MHAAVQILMEDQGEQGPSETVQAISDEPRFVITSFFVFTVSVIVCFPVSKCSVKLKFRSISFRFNHF